MLQSFGEGPVFILIDGLDECDAKSVVEVCRELASLHTLSSDEQQKVRPIIISRLLDDKCKRYLAKFRVLQLNNANGNVGRDLSIFVHSRVSDIAREKHYADALRERVLAAILQNSEGTFLWAGFVLRDLEETDIVDVEDCLAKLPSQLDGLYDRILQEIPQDKTAVVEKILKWVVLAVRPLTVPELAAAISPGPGETPSTVELITARIGMCRHLLSISQDVVKLVHQSARDYLTSCARPSTMLRRFYLNVQQAHSEITQLCISKMADMLETAEIWDVFNEFCTSFQASINPLLEPIIGYSIEYWHHHARLSDGWSTIHDSIVTTFFKTKTCRTWVLFSLKANRIPCPKKVLLKSEVHLASYLGLKGIVSASINKKGFNVKRLLPFKHLERHLACAGLFGGHTDIVEFLVKKEGASVGNVFARSSFFSSPIHIAAATNNVPALKLLTGERTDIVNRLNYNGWTPLHHAALLDSVEACQYLISKGAHIDLPDRRGWTPLHYASLPARAFINDKMNPDDYEHFVEVSPTIAAATEPESGHTKKTNAVQVLLDAKANPNPAPGGRGLYTPLHNAIRNGRAQEVEALVRAGADITVKDEKGRNALYTMASSYISRTVLEEIATILVDAGAKLDPELELKRPFMLDAIEIDSLFLVKLAIRLSTDLSYIDDEAHSFLYHAGNKRCKEIVGVLLEAGVDINRDTAVLSEAANNGQWKLCKLILEGDTQPKIDYGFNWPRTITSLTVDYDPSLVKAIIKAGAGPNLICKGYGTPLIIAVTRGSHEVVVDLIAERADVNLQYDGISALDIALYNGHEPIVESLLAAGAKTASGISPLGHVSMLGLHHKMVDFLISQEGADPNEETSTGYTPLEMASAMGHERVVAELVQAGADVRPVFLGRIIALSDAASNDHDKIARMLMGDDWADQNRKIRLIANQYVMKDDYWDGLFISQRGR